MHLQLCATIAALTPLCASAQCVPGSAAGCVWLPPSGCRTGSSDQEPRGHHLHLQPGKPVSSPRIIADPPEPPTSDPPVFVFPQMANLAYVQGQLDDVSLVRCLLSLGLFVCSW